MRALTLAIVLAGALTPLSAMAATATAAADANSDARCLMTMAALASSQDQNQARFGQEAVIYFAGRVKAREPSYDFATRLKPIAASLTNETLQAEAQRCGPMVVKTMEELQAAQKAFGPPPAATGRPAPAPAPKP
jgi:hypothetical protein